MRTEREANLALAERADRTPSAMLPGIFYVWADEGGFCERASTLHEARGWVAEFAAEGKPAYITNARNEVIG